MLQAASSVLARKFCEKQKAKNRNQISVFNFLLSAFHLSLSPLPFALSLKIEKVKSKSEPPGLHFCFQLSTFPCCASRSAPHHAAAQGGKGFARFAVTGQELENPLVFPGGISELSHANVGIGQAQAGFKIGRLLSQDRLPQLDGVEELFGFIQTLGELGFVFDIAPVKVNRLFVGIEGGLPGAGAIQG